MQSSLNATLLFALNAVDDPIAVIDSGGIFLFANRSFASLYGYADPLELLGRDRSLIFGEPSKIRFIDEALRQREGGGIWRGVVLGRRQTGDWIRREAKVVPTGDGSALWVCSGAERTSTDLCAERSGLAPSIVTFSCHEIRNPLSTIEYAAELASNPDSISDEKRSDYLRLIRLSAGKVATALNQLSLLAKLKSGSIRRQINATTLAEMLEVLKQSLADSSAIQFDILAGSSDTLFACDASLLGHAIGAIAPCLWRGPALEPIAVGIRLGLDALSFELPRWKPEDQARPTAAALTSESLGAVSRPEGNTLALLIASLCAERHGGSLSAGTAPGGRRFYILTIPTTG